MTPIADTFAYIIPKAGYISSDQFDVFPGVVNVGHACITPHDLEKTRPPKGDCIMRVAHVLCVNLDPHILQCCRISITRS